MDNSPMISANSETQMNADFQCDDLSITFDLKEELTPIYQEFQSKIDKLQADPTIEDSQVDVCLYSRSAFTDFYSLGVLQHKIDDWAATELNKMFQRALVLLPTDCRYRTSVSERYKEFEEFCENIRSRDPFDTSNWAAIETEG